MGTPSCKEPPKRLRKTKGKLQDRNGKTQAPIRKACSFPEWLQKDSNIAADAAADAIKEDGG